MGTLAECSANLPCDGNKGQQKSEGEKGWVENRNANEHWWCHLRARRLEPTYFPQGAHACHWSGLSAWRDEAGQRVTAWAKRQLGRAHRMSSGGTRIPGQPQCAFLEVKQQGPNSWARWRLRKTNRIKGWNDGNWVSALRIEPGARMASESEPWWSSTSTFTNLPSSASPFSQWGSEEKQCQGHGLGVKRFSRSPSSLTISHVVLNLFGLL